MTPEITIATLSLFIFGIAYAVIVRRLRQRTHGHHGQTAWLVVVGVGVVVGVYAALTDLQSAGLLALLFAADHGIMDSATWDRVKPRWAPKTGSMHGAIGVSLGRLVSDAGMRTGRNSHITCDCGRLWTHAVEIQVVNSNGTEIAETLRLCDACYAEFVAMEAAYA